MRFSSPNHQYCRNSEEINHFQPRQFQCSVPDWFQRGRHLKVVKHEHLNFAKTSIKLERFRNKIQYRLERFSTRLGIKGNALVWQFKSYLENNAQFVKTNDFSLAVRLLDCSVPQGCVMGPLLYSLYTGSFGDNLRQHGLSFYLYADDTQTYSTFSWQEDEGFVKRCASLISTNGWRSAS